MNTPPLLAAAAVLFWGRQVGLLVPAILIAAVLEAARFALWRLDLSRENQYRTSDICAALLGLAAAVLYFTREPLRAVMLMLQWFPVFMAPMAAVQAWSSARKLDAGAFFWLLRKPQPEGPSRWQIDISYPYIALCVLCAGNANVRTWEYYPANVLLGGWALWSVRPKSARAAVWLLLLALAAGLGYEGHRRLHSLQAVIESKASGLVYGFLRAGQKDPFRSSTAIGSIGELKRFGHIVLRVRAEGGKPPPALLRNACYDMYKGGNWFAHGAAFSDAPGDGEGGWELSRTASPEGLALAMPLAGGAGVLPLPAGASRIEGLPAEALRRNRFGAVQVEGGPGAAEFTVRFGREAAPDCAPGPADLAVPPAQAEFISGIAARLRLAPKKPSERVLAVAGYFADGFAYSLSQGGLPRTFSERAKAPGRPLFSDPLEDFLARTRSGHCEYFASATVLLLRQAGVPARYATGFSVQEYSRLEKAYIVRQRHAHAWARVFVDGAWRDLDTTPPSWSLAEESGDGPLQPLKDFGAWLKFSALRALRGNAGGPFRRGLAWLLLPAALWLGWKFRKGIGKLTLDRLRGAGGAGAALPGLDSDLYSVEKRLRGKGLGRRPWEPFTAWARRVGPLLKDEAAAGRLKALASLHDRYRFDPAGLGAGEREALRSGAENLLHRPLA